VIRHMMKSRDIITQLALKLEVVQHIFKGEGKKFCSPPGYWPECDITKLPPIVNACAKNFH